MSPSMTRRTLASAAALTTVAASLATATPAHANQSKRIAIIGSGYGGAVAARKLTSQGFTVDLIEMGADWENMAPANGKVFTKMVSPSARSMWFKDRTDLPFSQFFNLDIVNQRTPRGAGVLDVEKFDFMKVYVGRGVGGGSLVNGGMAVTPPRSFFEKVLPQVDADEMFNTYFPSANANLKVELPPTDFLGTSKYYQFTRVGAAQGKKAGIKHQLVPNVYDWEYMRKESFNRVTKSALDGQVIFGNDHGKRSLPKTILKEALDTGRVNLIAMTEVETLTQKADGSFDLALKTIDFNGNVTSRRTATYDRVVLAAGSIGTARLLLKAKNQGTVKNLPANTGAGWGPNGNIMAARSISQATGTYQSGIPAMGLSNWDDSTNSVFAELAPLPIPGLEMRTSLYLAITNNPNLAKFSWDANGNKLALDWDSAKAAPSVQAARAFLDRLNRIDSRSRYRTDLFDDNKIFADYFSYHPLGGMILGEATDLNGEVKGVPGLFVMDGSLIPGKIGVNPFVTITAIAERNMDRLVAAKRFN